MITTRQIERLWTAKSYDRLFRDLIANRPEATLIRPTQLTQPFASAAFALIRLDELHQDYTPLYTTLLRHLIANQQPDGGWADPVTTAICLRALLLGRSAGGQTVDRALAYLATLQKSEGLWPQIPIRRLPADPYTSALILYQLADTPQFRDAVRFFDAVHWFEFSAATLDPETRALWSRVQTRCRVRAQLTQIAEKRTISD